MLTKENIIFEDNILIVGDSQDKERIRNRIFELAKSMILDLGLPLLNKIYIKRQMLCDNHHGAARGDNEIELSFETATKLALDDIPSNSKRRQDALATLYHEGYHLFDYRRVKKKLIPSCPSILDKQSKVSRGYSLWTEFHAMYSTFNICEKESKYESFEKVFSERQRNPDDCRYFASQIMGYWLNKGHDPKCDRLVVQYLNLDYIEEAKQHLQDMLTRYHNISCHDLESLSDLFDKLVSNEIDLSKLQPLSQGDFLKMLRNESRGE